MSKAAHQVKKAVSHNLYLFRHLSRNHVIVSRQFDLQNSQLRQVAEHRPGLTIRRDLWSPFAVLTGMRSEATVANIYNQIVTEHEHWRGKKHRFDDPLETVPDWVWTPPVDVVNKSMALCDALNDIQPEELTVALHEDVDTIKPTIWWERHDYRQAVQNRDKQWPSWLLHESLKLRNGRFPVDIPGFDLVKHVRTTELGAPRGRRIRQALRASL
ncbi:hypothetical protein CAUPRSCDRAFT_11087 [Caulochytrium protostelioides]|uniref:Uncharacterized protein n=1 Tax=Caulochytrium protostelioides TaxID=1555241 RepID=A0A4P9WXZ6_9FUNG|nr:hypothetical protein CAUPRSCDRAFT_11087 [Caulochytrium protostelioides]